LSDEKLQNPSEPDGSFLPTSKQPTFIHHAASVNLGLKPDDRRYWSDFFASDITANGGRADKADTR
jgi:hypothetical protein